MDPRLRPACLVVLAACSGDPRPQKSAPTDTAASTAPSTDTDASPDPGADVEAWPDPAELPDGVVTLVHDGTVLSPGQTLSFTTAPAGLPDRTTLRLVLTNRTDHTLTFSEDGSEDGADWLTGTAFSWTSPPPARLAPEQSAALELYVDVSAEVAATTHSATLAVPGGPSIGLDAEVPRPLRLVVVGTGRYSAVSDSYGAAFETERVPGDATTARDVVWGGGRFLRADRAYDDWEAPGVYQWSEDGLSWHDSASSDDFWVSDCAHAWSRFYCVRSSSWTSSDDGAVVLHDANGWGQLLNAVAFVPAEAAEGTDEGADTGETALGDRLIAVGRAGRRLLSADGASWTEDVSSTDPSTLNAVAYGDGVLVAVGGTDNLVTAASTDGGSSWTETLLCDDRYATFYTVVFGDGVFLASAQSNSCAQVWRSVDGVDWTAVSTERAVVLAYTNGWFVGVVQPWGQPAQLVRSVDGAEWTVVHEVPDGVGIQAAATETWEQP